MIYDWPVRLPTCAPAGACTPGTSVLATSVSDGTVNRDCAPFNGSVNEVQTATVNQTSGKFTLRWNEDTTAGIDWDASAADVESALERLSGIGNGDVAVARSGLGTVASPYVYQVTFRGGLAGQNVGQMTAPSGTVAITTSTSGDGFSTVDPQPGLYCSIDAITFSNNQNLIQEPGFGFVAPDITFAGQVYRGYDSLYGSYGGFVAFGYAKDVISSGTGMGFRGSVFAPFGDVSFSGSSSSAVAPGGAGGCGFIEAQTISLTGADAHWAGLGPGFGPTTTPGTTTAGVTTPGTVVGGVTSPNGNHPRHGRWRHYQRRRDHHPWLHQPGLGRPRDHHSRHHEPGCDEHNGRRPQPRQVARACWPSLAWSDS